MVYEVERKVKLKIAIQINETKEVIEVDNELNKEEVLEIVKNENKIKKTCWGK